MTRNFIIFFILSTITWTSKSLETKSDDEEFLRKQEVVFQLLWHTKEAPKNYPEIFERVKNYKIEDVRAACENKNYAKEFETHLTSDLLPRGQVFSIFRDELVDEIKTIFNVFHNAKSFEDFMAMAAWSNLVVNEISWIYAFVLAILHRLDTKNIRLPNIFEILPQYFFNTDVIMQAYRIKSGEVAGITDHYTIYSNYTNDIISEDEGNEYKLNYFHDDVGLNEFYFYFISRLPFWMNSNEKTSKNIRGEIYYYVHKFLLTKYKIERLTQGLREIEDIDWDQTIVTGYYPSMIHINGMLFPIRNGKAHVPAFKYKFIEEAKKYESRISKALDLGELTVSDSSKVSIYDSKNGFNQFCNALEGNTGSPNIKFYGSLDRVYRRILGYAPEFTGKYRLNPSALEMSFTSLRDPGFYRMCKKIVDYGLRFKRNLPMYKREELSFDGVRIDYVQLDNLVTYMSDFESVLNHPRVLHLDDAYGQQSSSIQVKVHQLRLDHKPFYYRIGINSEHETKAIVRIFLGPKHDSHGNQLELDENSDDFYELDRWIVDLKQGSNKIERSSLDSVYTVPDPPSSHVYNNLISRALKTSDKVLIHDLISQKLHRGFPRRLLLPRGSKTGLPLRLVVCLHLLEPNNLQRMENTLTFEDFPLDGRPLGFPFDRPIKDVQMLDTLRNFMTKDVRVFDEDAKDLQKDLRTDMT